VASLLAVVLAVLAAASGPAPEPVGPPGSETYGREFCEVQSVPTSKGGRIGLTVERGSVRAGRAAFGRVENRSQRGWVEFGVDYHVQRLEEGVWRPGPGFHMNAWVAIGLSLAPGQAGYCMRYDVPDQAPPGRYRFMRPMSADADGNRPYYAPFRVTP